MSWQGGQQTFGHKPRVLMLAGLLGLSRFHTRIIINNKRLFLFPISLNITNSTAL
jgi:hypothetical protein